MVKEKAKAKEIFDAAVARGETAGLLRQDSQASDVFSTEIGNLPAGGKIIVEITYIGELKQDDIDSIRFTIPTSIAPRYGSGPLNPDPFGAVLSNAGTFAQGGQINITVDVNLPDGLSVKSVQSPSHPIAVTLGTLSTALQADPVMNKASAALSLGSSSLEKDFVLIVHSKGTGIPKALLETHPTIPNQRALMTTLVPRFSLPPAQPEIVFVADRSGSMAGNMQMLISAMKVFLKSMPTGVRFNICSFGTRHEFLWSESKSYSSETVRESMQHISTFGANFGGTETFNAIKATVDRRLGNIPLEIILLTDGDIWNQGPLFAYVNEQVEKSQGSIRVFPLGIGIGVSHALIEGLARAGNGFAQAVQSGERLDNSVVRMLRGALSPHITDYTLEVKYAQDDDDFEVVEKVTDGMKNLCTAGKSGDKMLLDPNEPIKSDMKKQKLEEKIQVPISLFDPNLEPDTKNNNTIADDGDTHDLPNLQPPKLLQAPHKIPSLVPFSRTTVYILMGPETIQRNPTSVVLRATSSHGPLVLDIPIEVLPERDQTIHQLAARKASQDLEESRGWIYDGEATNGILIKDKYPTVLHLLVEKEAVRLGEMFQVANKWCSFVAVSTENGKITEGTATSSSTPTLYPPTGVVNHCDANIHLACALVSPTSSYSVGSSSSFSLGRPPSLFGNLPSGATLAKKVGGLFGSATSSFAFGSAAPPTAPVVPSPYAPMTRQSKSPWGSAASSSAFPHAAPPPPVPEASSRHAKPTQTTFSFNGLLSSNSPGGPSTSFAKSSSGPNLVLQAGERSDVFHTPITQEEVEEDADEFGDAANGAFTNSFGSPILRPARRKVSRQQQQQSANPPAIRTDAEIVLAIIDLQGFDGSWAAERESLSSLLGFEIPKGPDGVEEEVWVTVLVITFLETKMGGEEGVWGLVVDKARAYVQTAVKDVKGGIEYLERLAGEAVKK